MSQRRAQFFASLARLTGAGLPVGKAGDFLRDHTSDRATQQAITALQDGLNRGGSIAGALRPALTELEYRMVGAAESGGRLSDGFAHLEKYYTLLAAARKKMRRAAMYPLLVLNVAALTTGVVTHMAGRPPLPAVAISLGILWVILLTLYFLTRLVVAAAAKNKAADTLLRTIPIVRQVWKNLALTRWSAVMHFHIISGQKFSTALESAAGAGGSATLAESTLRLARAAAAGQSIADAMQHERVFPPFFTLGFATAEVTGTLDHETAAQTRSCMEDASTAMDALTEWLPRLLYLAAVVYGVWQVFRLAGGIGAQYQRALDGF